MANPNQMANAVFPRSHVGFDSITQQIERKLLKRGFQFNVICVGMSKLCRSFVSLRLILHRRPNGTGEIYADQHHFRVAPD